VARRPLSLKEITRGSGTVTLVQGRAGSHRRGRDPATSASVAERLLALAPSLSPQARLTVACYLGMDSLQIRGFLHAWIGLTLLLQVLSESLPIRLLATRTLLLTERCVLRLELWVLLA
jgi:hypothetical protein